MSHLGSTNPSLSVASLRELARKQLTNVLDSVCDAITNRNVVYSHVYLVNLIFYNNKFIG